VTVVGLCQAAPIATLSRHRARSAHTHAELDALAAELSALYRALPKFGSGTGLRPEEWGRPSDATSTAASGS
jgi:hypothetical protein